MALQGGTGRAGVQLGGGDQQGQLHRARRLIQQLPGGLPLQPSQVPQDAQGPILQLAVGYGHIHHAVAMHLAQPHHHAGGEDVERHLGGGAGLETGGTGEQLRSGEQANVDGAGHRRLFAGYAGQGDGQGAEGLGLGQSTNYVGGGAPSGDAHQAVARTEAAGL